MLFYKLFPFFLFSFTNCIIDSEYFKKLEINQTLVVPKSRGYYIYFEPKNDYNFIKIDLNENIDETQNYIIY